MDPTCDVNARPVARMNAPFTAFGSAKETLPRDFRRSNFACHEKTRLHNLRVWRREGCSFRPFFSFQ